MNEKQKETLNFTTKLMSDMVKSGKISFETFVKRPEIWEKARKESMRLF